MPALPDYKVSPSVQPKPEDYGYDLDKALASVMGLHAIIPSDAFTAETLGTERAGNARADPRARHGADHRLSDHRGRDGLAASQ